MTTTYDPITGRFTRLDADDDLVELDEPTCTCPGPAGPEPHHHAPNAYAVWDDAAGDFVYCGG